MGRMSHETRLRAIGLWKLKYRLKDIQAKLRFCFLCKLSFCFCLLCKLYCLFSVYYDMTINFNTHCYTVPSISAAWRCLSGQSGAVNSNTAGAVTTTDRPWGCEHSGHVSVCIYTSMSVLVHMRVYTAFMMSVCGSVQSVCVCALCKHCMGEGGVVCVWNPVILVV